jgi:hypothetical protein
MPRALLGMFCITALGLPLAGCQSEIVSQFPDGLTAIEENTATPPAPTATDEFPEERSVLTGEDDGGAWLHGFAYVKAPIALVWTAFKDPNVVVDRREITSFTTAFDVEDEYDVSFRCSHVVEDVVTVEFDVTWRESAVEGPAQAFCDGWRALSSCSR